MCIRDRAYGLGAGNILSEEEKYAILKEMTLEFGQELAQEGDFQEDVAKEISVVKGGRISLDHYYSSCLLYTSTFQTTSFTTAFFSILTGNNCRKVCMA